ncbi:HAD hydrolase-like protein [Lactonifactor longoviformis]|uniref:HAD family hydrolase n=1 Tax=Lactonifactor TaxID=420345 RepID=UPI0012B09EDD|nr:MULTISPECIES: HAD hydrolase-like protein [Lactonifactor]MCQ4671944.1 HAD hydrolase-like protein [Lactonifactor longoviformis]MSA02879.1 HAD hydrolase-like protein [Lactonifactor sp. BIOML-A5]MSA09181.1 HAD hydrolase-like protein [Lactonifactor sp. BIOML-A4]MSA13526.1 HAD hydrolase-like protein [Lactonifactor sp. BIOML-A3]MSA18174.1 HAD hydrolase-like protein [Lactonifactor sp. BIOML-A2]
MNLLFDYDGTLHDCARIYIPAFREVYRRMTEAGLTPYREWKDTEIIKWLGYSPRDMWNAFLPSLSDRAKETYSEAIGTFMEEQTASGKAHLYPGAEVMLEELKKEGHALLLLSNCKTAYLEQHRKIFQLDRYFTGYYPAEAYGYQKKWKIFPLIKKKHPGAYVVIGDRFQDMEIGARWGIPAIGCTYGYGKQEELRKANGIAGSIEEVKQQIDRIGDRAG